MKKVVLVTGGAGYIGSHTCKALARAGFLPVVLDNLSRGFEWAVKWGPLERGDISDASLVDAAVARHQPVAAIHFAAFAYVGESVTDPNVYYENNVVGSLHLFNSLLRNGVNKIVFSSSCATYGIPSQLPIVETCPQLPVNPYGATKLIVERILSDFNTAYQLRSVALRYFNAAGADRDGEIGEAHDPETHLIPLAIAATRGGAPLCVMGTDYDTPDGTAIRDYIHVEDLAHTHVRALEYLLAGGNSTALNVGTGKGVSVMEIIRAVEAITGRQVVHHKAPRRAGDPPVLYANPARLKTILGLDTEKFFGIDKVVTTAAQWDNKRLTHSPTAG